MTRFRNRQLLFLLTAIVFVAASAGPISGQSGSSAQEKAPSDASSPQMPQEPSSSAKASPAASSVLVSPEPSPSMYPSPLSTTRSINTYLNIVSDDAPLIQQAKDQASKAGNASPAPAASPASSPIPKKTPDLAPAPSVSQDPTPSPSPGAGSSDVTGAVLNSISTLNAELQTDLVAQFKRRDVAVVTQNQFDDYCLHHADAYALHWSVVDPTIRLDESWQLFGYTSSTLEIYWHLTTCNPQQPVRLSTAKLDIPNYHTTAGTNFQVRAPTDFLASLFGALALIHPAGRAIVSIGLTGGISAVSGALNTILNTSYSSHDLVQSTERRVTAEVANAYCSGEGHPMCKHVKPF